MAEMMTPGPACDDRSIREAVCIHTRKIFDACRSKECAEDLRVYFDECAQRLIDQASSVKSGSAELIHAYIDVEPVRFNRGFYTVNVRYFYRVTAEACGCGCRPVQVSGLAMFNQRCVLFGSEGGAKVFSSSASGCTPVREGDALPGGGVWEPRGRRTSGERADAETVSRAIQRDARRYDGGFTID